MCERNLSAEFCTFKKSGATLREMSEMLPSLDRTRDNTFDYKLCVYKLIKMKLKPITTF